VEFDISIFAKRFKEVIFWMLKDKYGKEIKEDLRKLRKRKESLLKDPDDLEVLKEIIKIIKTNSWRLRLSKNFEKKWLDFVTRHGKNFRTKEAMEDLIKLVGKRRKESIKKLLSYPTLRDFTKNLYKLAKEGKTEVIGEKGRDDYLRDFGYWDRVPMDRHEMRFIIRSGIYHACSTPYKSDPLNKEDLQNSLVNFCTRYLSGFIIDEIDLGKAPGVVDIFIWSFSAENRYNICRATPKCDICKFKGFCLYSILKENTRRQI